MDRFVRTGLLPRPGQPWRRQPAAFVRTFELLQDAGLFDGGGARDETIVAVAKAIAGGR